MKERPIRFSGPMVRAILAGTKTQTRRPFKAQDPFDDFGALPPLGARCPFGEPGDRLWVRETWGDCGIFYSSDGESDTPQNVAYRADHAAVVFGADLKPRAVPSWDLASWNWVHMKWRPSIHMPRWASRLVLDVVDVRAERLQAITEADACAEGVTPPDRDPEGDCWTDGKHVTAFERLWNETYGWEPNAWAANPWVWVVSFRRYADPTDHGSA